MAISAATPGPRLLDSHGAREAFWTASSSSRASITANQAISKPDVMKGLSRVSKPAACGLRTRTGVPATPSASEHLPKQALHPVRELHL
jgi:hypothetical protein